MPTFPNRYVRIVLADETRSVEIQGLKMEFEFEKATRSKPNSGKVQIWNLKPSTAKFAKSATSIQILAGYDNNYGLVYKGDIRRASNRRSGQTNKTRLAQAREGLDFITEIGLGGHLEALTSAYFQRSYAGTVLLSQIVKDALPSFALVSTNIDILPAITMEDFVWSGKTSDLLDSLLEPTDFDWYEDDGVIVFHEIGVPLSFNPVRVNVRTGLLSTPTIEKRSVSFKTMLNPALRVGGFVELESKDNPEANGNWKIKKLVLRGSNRDTEHTTEVEVRRAEG